MELSVSVLLMVCADWDLSNSECRGCRTSRCVRSEVVPDAPLGPLPSRLAFRFSVLSAEWLCSSLASLQLRLPELSTLQAREMG